MVKQAIKKGTGIQKRGLGAWKEKTGMAIERPKEGEIVKESELATSNANKPLDWLIMPKSFQDVTKLPGVPIGFVSEILGHSNVGKTTMLNHLLVAAQNQKIIPVIFDTENSFSFKYAMSMGFKAEPIYGDVEVEDVDEETGEIKKHVENKVINYDGDFIYYNNRILAEQYGTYDYSTGKTLSKKRNSAVLEDIAKAMNDLMDAQESGEIDASFLFCWDSVGSIACFQEYSAGKMANPMWAAAAISRAFSNITNNRIPSSRKVSSKHTNTFVYINKVWMDNMTNPMGMPIMRQKGGSSLHYAARVTYVLGGVNVAGIKFLKATSKGLDYTYGIQTKIKVQKNHLDAPYNVCYEGAIIATDCGFIGLDELDTYKKQHVSQILKELNDRANGKFKIEESDISYEEVEDES